jgi:SAM-dependent methyltransferase
VAADLDHDALVGVGGMFRAMAAEGEAPPDALAIAVRADAGRLPFPDNAFDVVIAAEILEHIPNDLAVMAEATRVLRPGGTLAVTVPRWWPERLCWMLSDAYHQVKGGHVRIYRRSVLVGRLRAQDLVPRGGHHAHALHSPYWWLKCLFGIDNQRARLPRWYHAFLVYDIMRRPRWTAALEGVLNPVLGKSVVVYLSKPESRA